MRLDNALSQRTLSNKSKNFYADVSEQILDGIPGFLTWFAFLFCILAAHFVPRTMLLIAGLFGLYSAVRFALAGIANVKGLREIEQWENTDWRAHYDDHADEQSLDWDDVHHLVVIPNYNEPMVILRRTLDALKEQYGATERMTVIMAMEERADGHEAKIDQLTAEYADSFKHFFCTIHPEDLPGELKCKSANEAWAVKQIAPKLTNEFGYDMNHILVSTMDADTRWHPRHFYALTALFALEPDRHRRFWQSPIRYHGNIWTINPMLRIVNAYATAIELSYLAAPWWRAMPMSSYALSLRLLHESGYWDVDVIADEWHMYIKAYFALDGDLRLNKVMLPFMADATQGEGVYGELKERYLQTLRHAWGSKEIGYFMAGMIQTPAKSFLKSLRLLVRISHDLLMAGAGWVILTLGAQLPILMHPDIIPVRPGEILNAPGNAPAYIAAQLIAEPVWILLMGAGLLVVILAGVFWYQDVRVRPPRDTERTPMETFWTIISFPLMPIITLIVLAIPTIQAQTRLMLGMPLRFRVSRKV